MKRIRWTRVLSVMALGVASFLLLGLGVSCEQRTSALVFDSIIINAPLEKVWAYLDNANNWEEFNPWLKKVSDVQGQGVGATWNWKADVKGMDDNKGKSMYVEYVPKQKTVELASSTLFDAKITKMLMPCPEGAKLIIIMEVYSMLPEDMKYEKAREFLEKQTDKSLKSVKKDVEKALEKEQKELEKAQKELEKNQK